MAVGSEPASAVRNFKQLSHVKLKALKAELTLASSGRKFNLMPAMKLPGF